MAKAWHRHHRYSAEEIMNAVMASSDSEQLNTNSDESDISEVESLQEPSRPLPQTATIAEKRDKSKELQLVQ